MLRCRGTDPGGGGGGGGEPPSGIVWIYEDQGFQDACLPGENLWWKWELDLRTGETPFNSDRIDLTWDEYCAPPAGPAPPTTPEFTAELERIVPPPILVSNPEGIGVAGLETWFWYDTDTQPVTLTGTLDIRSFDITYELNAVQWSWQTGDGTELESTTPGSDTNLPASAAATHTYETKAYYDVELCVTWTGTWAVVGEPSNTVPPRDFCSTTVYRVDEIVSRVTG